MVNQMYPSMAKASVKLLQAAGYEVIIPKKHVCCGQPAFNSGYWDEARTVALHFLETFKEAHVLVGASGSCISMITHEYKKLGISLPQNLKVYEITDFLFRFGQNLQFNPLEEQVAMHDSCHALRKLKVESQPRALLNRIPGMEVLELDDNKACCGFGGTFSVKMPHVSIDMAQAKVASIKRTGAHTVAAVDVGCLMNIQSTAQTQGDSLKTCHVVELLAKALRS